MNWGTLYCNIADLPELTADSPKAMSFFAGCGGSSLGYRMAGFRVLYANEFIEAAGDTYRLNCPKYTYLDRRDIRDIPAEDAMRLAGVKPGELDVLDGSPPCASFSTAGKREDGWGKVKRYSTTFQRTDDLFWEYIRMVKAIQPKYFVAENVPGLIKGTAKGLFLEILRDLKGCGYNVKCALLDASWLGVPQRRVRAIFIGVRNDIGTSVDFPKPLAKRIALKTAIPWIDAGPENNPFIIEPDTDISRYEIGKEFDVMKKPGTVSKRYFQLIRPSLSEPTGALVWAQGSKSSAGIVHPLEKRRFSIAEMRRISGFPDDFVITGDYITQWERLARAVPPPMMCAVASSIKEKLQ